MEYYHESNMLTGDEVALSKERWIVDGALLLIRLSWQIRGIIVNVDYPVLGFDLIEYFVKLTETVGGDANVEKSSLDCRWFY